MKIIPLYIFVVASFLPVPSLSQKTSKIGKGWAKTSVNVVVYRKNSLVSYNDRQCTVYHR
jgi:hypothetical protein